METASSMKARGYGIAKRTSYLYYKFNKLDFALIIFILITAAISTIGLLNGYGRVTIYPSFEFHNLTFNVYYVSFLLLLIPLSVLELREKLYWHGRF